MKKTIATTLALGACIVLPALAVAGNDALLQVLQNKGILTADEVARIGHQPETDANAALVRLLRQKGVISADEAKKIAGKENEAARPATAITPEEHKALSVLKGWSIGVLSYLDYSAGQKALTDGRSESYNRFSLTRGYLTVKKKVNSWLSGRMTTDIHRDSTEGASTYGDYTVRLKYLYAEFRPDDLGFLTNMKVEAGQGHTPWLDFEEHVNPYRVQGTMATDRAGVQGSSDLGLSLQGYFGGTLADAVARTGNHHYDGRYGSWHIGLYNGSGYHSEEVNGDKAIEGRLTLRPLPDAAPGLQFSYLGIYGEGNKDYPGSGAPDYRVNLGMVSYEHPLGILTAQYYQSTGNASGTWTYGPNHEALDTAGYSFFGRVRLPFISSKLSLLARYDHFDEDVDDHIANDTAYDMYLAGLSYDLTDSNRIVLVYENTDYENDAGVKHKLPVPGNNLGDDDRFQVAYRLAF
ncbi:MAG TPA: hypothetical protein ENK27_03930 [Desulfobulbus sp.]|nr:hypothetical protein [Desulfobulbus sp.]